MRRDAPAAGEIAATNARPAPTKPVRNVMACLVHESPDCVLDLVRNLTCLDPASTVLLYNGATDPDLLTTFAWDRLGAVVHPDPKPMAWGRLHEFALDSMRFALEHLGFDTMTIVDSDQLASRRDYSGRLTAHLAGQQGVGMLVNATGPAETSTTGPVPTALEEIELWRPLLRRFPGGTEKFVHWCFWPSTVFTAAAARDLTDFFATDVQLARIMAQTNIWATEEIILPTLVALLGYAVQTNPCSYDFVRYRVDYTGAEIDAALGRSDVYWLHPVPRRYDDPRRARVRAVFGAYERA